MSGGRKSYAPKNLTVSITEVFVVKKFMNRTIKTSGLNLFGCSSLQKTPRPLPFLCVPLGLRDFMNNAG